MDIENCAVTEDSLNLLEEEIKVLASEPSNFLVNLTTNKQLFGMIIDHFQRSEADVKIILQSTRRHGVKDKDVKEALALIKQKTKEMASKIPSTTMKIRIKDHIQNAPVADEATLPVSYKFTGNCGISVGLHDGPDSIVSSYPLFITCIKHNILTNIEYVTLAWIADGTQRSVTVERKIIAKKSQIVDLASYGLPITSTNADRIIDYLFAYEKTNAHCIDKVEATHKLGWTPDMEGFLWGHQFFVGKNPDPTSGKKPAIEFLGRDQGDGQGDDQIADGFRSGGSYDTWVSLVNDVLEFPDVIFLLYASLTPPLLPIFGVKNFSLELSNQSSSGKTTAMLLGASCWGVPELHASSFVNTWNATSVWIGRAASILNGLPLYLDDTKLAKAQDRRGRDGDLVTNTIYLIASGRDKARGTLQGTERTEPFRTILFSTGESPSLDLSNDGGSRGRLIDLWGNPFLKTDKESKLLVDRINRTTQDHYGHAGPRLVQFILDHRDQWPLWKEAYQEANDLLTQTESMSPIEMRLGEYFAAIATAIVIIHAALPELRRDKPVKELLASVWSRARKEAREADTNLRALQLVQELIIDRSDEIYTNDMASQGVLWKEGGFIGIKEIDKRGNFVSIGLTRRILEEVLRKNGLPLQETIKNWGSKGWLLQNESSDGYQRQVSIPGTSEKSKMNKKNLYCLKKEVIAQEE
jgi:hypothetical protein